MAVGAVPPPEGFNPGGLKQGRAWCPYCGKETEFGHDSRLDYARCMGCGISERDFYVRQYNRLWADGALEKFAAAVKKSRRKYVKPFPWGKKGKKGEITVELPQTETLLGILTPPEPGDERKKTCARCGAPIGAAVSNRQKYCSDECRRQAERRKTKAREKRQAEKPPSTQV